MIHQDDIPVKYFVLADDDKDDCFLFQDVLDELNLDISLRIVHDGEQLMLCLIENNQLPEILFLDLNMPRKNGMECVSAMKASPRLKHIPVIILSTSFQKTEIDLLYEMGAQFYIRKPNEYDQLKYSILTAITMSAKLNKQQPSKQEFLLSPGVKYEYE